MRFPRTRPAWVSGLVILVIAPCLGIPQLTRAGEIYKSVDAEGHVTYSDRASSSTAQKTALHVDRPDAAEVARNAKDQEIRKVMERERKHQQAVDDLKKAKEDHDREVRCQSARDRYFSMKAARRLYSQDADGNRVYYSDAEGDAMRENARQAVAAACGT